MFANSRIGGVTVPCVVLYIIVVILIFAYGYILRRLRAKDPLARPLYSHPLCGELDGWSVTHFLFFALLGFLYPGRPIQFFTVGVCWEIFETLLGQNRVEVSGSRLQLVGDQDAEGRVTGDADAYWYGKANDITIDIFGYLIGSHFGSRRAAT